MLSSVKCANILLMSVLAFHGVALEKPGPRQNMKKFLFIKIFLTLIVVMGLTACKKVHQQLPQPNPGRMLQVELKMPEPWKKIVIGPTHSTEYPNIPKRFSMFMTGESGGALKPYLLIEDSTEKEYTILLAMTTGHYVGGKTLSVNLRHGNKTSHNKPGVFPLNNLKPPIKSKSVLEPTLYIKPTKGYTSECTKSSEEQNDLSHGKEITS